MKEVEEIESIYFIGIGGIGMSALARYYNHLGKKIYGYDRDRTSLTKKLEAEGMSIHYKVDVNQIPDNTDLVIYTPAIPDSNEELIWCRGKDFLVIKRAEALGFLSRSKKTIGIAGTHGKTTTSSMLSHILTECNTGVSALVGGLMVNYKGNFIYGEGDTLVVEADEYDRSFLHLEVDYAGIMSMDSDHLDIYETHDELLTSFEDFTLKIREGGKLFLKSGLIGNISKSTILEWNSKGIEVFDFGDEDARIYTFNEKVENGKFTFDIYFLGTVYEGFTLVMPGKHNAENASIAFAMACDMGLDPEDVKAALASFKGIKRRFEKVLDNDKVIIIDDYAHHPTEINAALSAVRMLYPEKKMTVVFQPHLFSRTQDFFEDFGKELSLADDLILTDIYPAREEPIEGVTTQLIYDVVSIENKTLTHKKEVVKVLQEKEVELLVILGAGDIDKEVKKIKKLYK
jgi:UDP-N-acetylmuramate--alanine ligase